MNTLKEKLFRLDNPPTINLEHIIARLHRLVYSSAPKIFFQNTALPHHAQPADIDSSSTVAIDAMDINSALLLTPRNKLYRSIPQEVDTRMMDKHLTLLIIALQTYYYQELHNSTNLVIPQMRTVYENQAVRKDLPGSVLVTGSINSTPIDVLAFTPASNPVAELEMMRHRIRQR